MKVFSTQNNAKKAIEGILTLSIRKQQCVAVAIADAITVRALCD